MSNTKSHLDELLETLRKAKSDLAEAKGDKSSHYDKKMTPERLAHLKEVAPHLLSQLHNQRATGSTTDNPELFAHGHQIAAEKKSLGDYHDAYNEHINSDEYKKASETKKMALDNKFKKDWHAAHENHHENTVNKLAEAHKQRDAAKIDYAHNKADKENSIFHGGQAGDAMSHGEAVAQFGVEGKDDKKHVSMSHDPVQSFANQNREYVEHKRQQGPAAPKITKRLAENADPGVKVERLAPGSAKKHHPILDKPENQKVLGDYYKDYEHTIGKNVAKVLKAKGVHESTVNVPELEQAGLIGMYEAAHHYKPEAGSSFYGYLNSKVGGRIESELRNQDAIPQHVRQEAKNFKAGSEAPLQSPQIAAPQPAAAQPAAPAAPKVIKRPKMLPEHEENLKRVDAQRAAVAPKPQGGE